MARIDRVEFVDLCETEALHIRTFRGVDPTNPIDASGGQTNTSSKTITAPSITTSAAGDALVGLFSADDGQSTINVPNSMSSAVEPLRFNAMM